MRACCGRRPTPRSPTRGGVICRNCSTPERRGASIDGGEPTEVRGVSRSTRSTGLDDRSRRCRLGRLRSAVARAAPLRRRPVAASCGGRRTSPAPERGVVLHAAMVGVRRAGRTGCAGVDGGRQARALQDPPGSRLAPGDRRPAVRRQCGLPGHGPHAFFRRATRFTGAGGLVDADLGGPGGAHGRRPLLGQPGNLCALHVPVPHRSGLHLLSPQAEPAGDR